MLLLQWLLGLWIMSHTTACAAHDPYRKPRQRESWWGSDADSSERSFFYGSFFDEGRR